MIYTFVCGAGNTFHNCFPVQEVGFGDGAEGVQDGRGFGGVGFELLEEAFG